MDVRSSTSTTTGYWLGPEQARGIAAISREQPVQLLGLPANQAGKFLTNGVDFYAISVNPGTTVNVFVSNVPNTNQVRVARSLSRLASRNYSSYAKKSGLSINSIPNARLGLRIRH
jgi:hypothetical protein